MKYVSTRGLSDERSFTDILLEGLAPDGGLYVPVGYPRFSDNELNAMRSMSYAQLAHVILEKFAGDIPVEDLRRMIDDTYTAENFGTEHITPLKKLDDGFYILGLSEGPTLAFKDLALQLLGRLFEYVLSKTSSSLNILGATSGDTGSAAEYAMRGRKGIRVFMLSPHGRMSEFQRRQMYTLEDKNIFNIAIRGVFDDCQDVVKKVNEDAVFKNKYSLGAVNSINWARIIAQTVYYVWAFLQVSADISQNNIRFRKSYIIPVSFAVPTGNFGNILAAYVAKRMGVPIHKLILATNENNVLEEFIRAGTYRPRKGAEVAATSSPSMDISKASNFERYIFDLVERDQLRMQELWQSLDKKGEFTITQGELRKTADDGFVAGSSTHADRLNIIRYLYGKYGITIDPHTADGVYVGMKNREADLPLICLETAKPAKFAATIREAVGIEPKRPPGYEKLEGLPERFTVMEPDAEHIKKFIAAHV